MRQSSDEPYRVQHLVQALELEKYCPLVLPYQEGLVTEGQNRVRKQSKLIEALKGSSKTPSAFILGVYETDIERAEWLLKEYHRARLQKIQTYALAIANQPENYASKLSRKESAFHEKYVKLRVAYLESTVTNYFIKPFRDLGVAALFDPQYRQLAISNKENLKPRGEDRGAFVLGVLVSKTELRKNIDFKLAGEGTGGLLGRQEILIIPIGQILPHLLSGEMALI